MKLGLTYRDLATQLSKLPEQKGFDPDMPVLIEVFTEMPQGVRIYAVVTSTEMDIEGGTTTLHIRSMMDELRQTLFSQIEKSELTGVVLRLHDIEDRAKEDDKE